MVERGGRESNAEREPLDGAVVEVFVADRECTLSRMVTGGVLVGRKGS